MALNRHRLLRGDDLHVPGYRVSADPGAVGAGLLWEDIDTGTLYKRNSTNTAWVLLGGTDDGSMVLEGPVVIGTDPGVATVPNELLRVGSSIIFSGTARSFQSSDSLNPAFEGRRSRSGPAAIQSGDVMAIYQGTGYDGSAYDIGAQLQLLAAGAWTATSHPTKVLILTTPAGSTTLATRVTVDETGMTLAQGLSIGGSATINGNTNSDTFIATQSSAAGDGARGLVYRYGPTITGGTIIGRIAAQGTPDGSSYYEVGTFGHETNSTWASDRHTSAFIQAVPAGSTTLTTVARFGDGSMYLYRGDSTLGNSPYVHLFRAYGSYLSPTAVGDADFVGGILFRGHDGTTYQTGAGVYAQTVGIWTSTNRGTSLLFSTVEGGTATADTVRWVLNHGGAFRPFVNNSYDLGQNNRTIRTAYVGTSIILGDANSANVYLTASINTTTGTYSFTVTGGSSPGALFTQFVDVGGLLYHRDNVRVLNKAGTGWVTWATRDTSGSESVINLSNVGSLGMSGAVTTGVPFGGTAGAWKLGTYKTAAVALNTGNYVELDIGGTLYKLGVVA